MLTEISEFNEAGKWDTLYPGSAGNTHVHFWLDLCKVSLSHIIYIFSQDKLIFTKYTTSLYNQLKRRRKEALQTFPQGAVGCAGPLGPACAAHHCQLLCVLRLARVVANTMISGSWSQLQILLILRWTVLISCMLISASSLVLRCCEVVTMGGAVLHMVSHAICHCFQDSSQIELLKELMDLQKDMVVMLLSMLEGSFDFTSI